jgi:pyruvate/2-oxoglutarate/acetoin dehydrogenase E1 component
MASLEDRLLKIFRQLGAANQSTLVAFAEFLATRPETVSTVKPNVKQELPDPVAIPRPDKETVVAAVKRLSRTYPMLDKAKMLGETSDLVGQHILQGRVAAEVIDELEAVFVRNYRTLKDRREQD